MISLFTVFTGLVATTQVLAQTSPGPSCAIACLGTVASADGCQGVNDVQCICTTGGIFEQAANCIDQQCDSSDFAGADSYLRAFCGGASAVSSAATEFTLSSVPATAASAASSAAGSAASAASSVAASVSGGASSAASAISSAVTSAAPSVSSVAASISSQVSASLASVASSSSAAAASASETASANGTSSSAAVEMYSHGALGWVVTMLAAVMGFGFAAVL